mmetsp:Transcript_23699/g.58921  ORF Transcript_23699/g.58921 Transcript_23699/m.58921 type:complete len:82 (+) Transcript_23699:235-480(+)
MVALTREGDEMIIAFKERDAEREARFLARLPPKFRVRQWEQSALDEAVQDWMRKSPQGLELEEEAAGMEMLRVFCATRTRE